MPQGLAPVAPRASLDFEHDSAGFDSVSVTGINKAHEATGVPTNLRIDSGRVIDSAKGWIATPRNQNPTPRSPLTRPCERAGGGVGGFWFGIGGSSVAAGFGSGGVYRSILMPDCRALNFERANNGGHARPQFRFLDRRHEIDQSLALLSRQCDAVPRDVANDAVGCGHAQIDRPAGVADDLSKGGLRLGAGQAARRFDGRLRQVVDSQCLQDRAAGGADVVSRGSRRSPCA